MKLIFSTKLKVLNLISSTLSVLCFLLVLYNYILTGDSQDSMIILFHSDLSIITLYNSFNILGLILMLIYQFYSPKYYKKSMKSLIAHILLFILTPNLSISLSICLSISHRSTCYLINELILILMYLRLIPLVFSLLQFNRFYRLYSPVSFPKYSPMEFTIKCLITRRRILTNSFIYIFGNTYCGFALWVIERRRDPGNLFDSFINSSWCSFVSSLGIGFGDMYPTTLLGRSVVTIWIFFGLAFSWYFILAASDTFTLSDMEFLVYQDINRFKAAVRLIEAAYKREDYSKELLEFKKEKMREYIAQFKYGDLLVKFPDQPPKDFRHLGSRVTELSQNVNELFNDLTALKKLLSRKLSKIA